MFSAARAAPQGQVGGRHQHVLLLFKTVANGKHSGGRLGREEMQVVAAEIEQARYAVVRAHAVGAARRPHKAFGQPSFLQVIPLGLAVGRQAAHLDRLPPEAHRGRFHWNHLRPQLTHLQRLVRDACAGRRVGTVERRGGVGVVAETRDQGILDLPEQAEGLPRFIMQPQTTARTQEILCFRYPRVRIFVAQQGVETNVQCGIVCRRRMLQGKDCKQARHRGQEAAAPRPSRRTAAGFVVDQAIPKQRNLPCLVFFLNYGGSAQPNRIAAARAQVSDEDSVVFRMRVFAKWIAEAPETHGYYLTIPFAAGVGEKTFDVPTMDDGRDTNGSIFAAVWDHGVHPSGSGPFDAPGSTSSLAEVGMLDGSDRPQAQQAPVVEVPTTAVSNVQAVAVDDTSARVTRDAVEHATSYWVKYEGQGNSVLHARHLSGKGGGAETRKPSRRHSHAGKPLRVSASSDRRRVD